MRPPLTKTWGTTKFCLAPYMDLSCLPPFAANFHVVKVLMSGNITTWQGPPLEMHEEFEEQSERAHESVTGLGMLAVAPPAFSVSDPAGV